MTLLLLLILLAWVAWGLYGLLTNERVGAQHWRDWPELTAAERAFTRRHLDRPEDADPRD